MGYARAANLDELSNKAKLIQITNAGLIESHPCNIIIMKKPSISKVVNQTLAIFC
jgi:hypothetical protein